MKLFKITPRSIFICVIVSVFFTSCKKNSTIIDLKDSNQTSPSEQPQVVDGNADYLAFKYTKVITVADPTGANSVKFMCYSNDQQSLNEFINSKTLEIVPVTTEMITDRTNQQNGIKEIKEITFNNISLNDATVRMTPIEEIKANGTVGFSLKITNKSLGKTNSYSGSLYFEVSQNTLDIHLFNNAWWGNEYMGMQCNWYKRVHFYNSIGFDFSTPLGLISGVNYSFYGLYNRDTYRIGVLTAAGSNHTYDVWWY